MKHVRPIFWMGFAVAVTACPKTDTVSLPANVSFVAVLEVIDGEVVDASSLRRANEAVTIFGDTTRNLVAVGFADQPLSGWLDRWANGRIPTTPIRNATGCAPRLPTPVWAGIVTENSSFETIDPNDVPRLTSAWLEARCPAFEADQVSVNIGCDTNPCLRQRTQTNVCGFRLDLSGCIQGSVDVVVQPDGSACIENKPFFACQPKAPVLDSAASYTCSGRTDESTDFFD
ncbi:MAG: hypothetical protein AAFN74_27740, partial [Myxococcota bacterium]